MKTLLAVSINLIALFLLFLYQLHSAAAVLLALSLLCWFFYFLWQRQNVVKQRIKSKIAGQNVVMPIEHIMFRAIESSGYSQASGMGYMVLTNKALYFELILLDLVITVPVTKLTDVEYVYRLKGISPGRKMLRILFTDNNGKPDSIAVNTKAMEKWELAVSQAISKANQSSD